MKFVFDHYLRHLCCSKGGISRENRLIDKGIKKLEKDLDIVNLLNLQNEFQEAKSVLFDRDDSKLLKMNKRRMISSEDGSKSDEDIYESLYKRDTPETERVPIRADLNKVFKSYMESLD